MATNSCAAPGALPGTPLRKGGAGVQGDPECTQGRPRARGYTSGIDTHRPSASSCPRRHPGWERRNQARTRTWWHLPKMGEQQVIRDLAGQRSAGGTEVFLSSHAHTTYRPREPATTARDMHWHKPDHPGLGPRAPRGALHPASHTSEKVTANLRAHSTTSLAGTGSKNG